MGDIDYEAKLLGWTKETLNLLDDVYHCVKIERLSGSTYIKDCTDFLKKAGITNNSERLSPSNVQKRGPIWRCRIGTPSTSGTEWHYASTMVEAVALALDEYKAKNDA